MSSDQKLRIEMETTKKPCMTVVMIPWLAHGHVSPYLELAKRLISKKNFQIYLCSTPIILTSINKRITEEQSHSIKLIEFHIQSQPDLPPHFHTTNGLPHHLHSSLERAMEMASPTFTKIIKSLKPDIIIHDFNQRWASIAAASLRIPAVPFYTSGVSVLCYFQHKMTKQDVDFPYPAMNLRGTYWNQKFQDMMSKIQESSVTNGQDNAVSTSSRTFDIILSKTFGEVEGKYIEYISELLGKKIVPTGPLIQDSQNAEENSEIMKWLNKKETSSTVLLSFGTEYILSREEREEIAKGLELSMVNFIWVLKFSIEENISIEEALPNGFLKRVGDRGLVVETWVPQAKILGHPNVGGFVSHCGWASTIEAMSFGVPIVALPINYDQPFNARLVEEMGVGIEVGRDDNGRFSGEEIALLIREVLEGENGKKIRDKAREMREIIQKKGDEEIDGVVEELYKLHNNNTAGESKEIDGVGKV